MSAAPEASAHAPSATAPDQRSAGYEWVPSSLVAAGAIVGLCSQEGGYFPSSWGPVAVLLLGLVVLWALIGGRTDAGRHDVALLVALGALLAWTALSVAWSENPSQTLLEVQRLLLVVASVAAVLLLAVQGSTTPLFLAIAGAAALVCGYAVGTRLFPESIGYFDPTIEYRLSEPIGYWNGLGIFASMGILLLLGAAVDVGRLSIRALGGALLPILALTLYFTYSRGAWFALAGGVAVLIALHPRPLRIVAALPILGVVPAATILVASRMDGLTLQTTSVASAAADGRRMALLLVPLVAASTGATLLLALAQARVSVGRSARRVIGWTLAVTAALVVGAGLVRLGGPLAAVDRARDSFAAPPISASATEDLNDRLFSLSGNGRVELWESAWQIARENPVAGSGAGSFERFRQADRSASFKARDAHSLYVESLAELGVVGLALVASVLAVPLVAAIRRRRTLLVPAAGASLAAFVVHAGVDWDWELSGVTVTALLVGCVCTIATRTEGLRQVGRLARAATVAAAVAGMLVAGTGWIGNDALQRSTDNLNAGNGQAALGDARRAVRFAPWSPYALTARGEAELAVGASDPARRSFREAIERDSGYWRAWLGLAVATNGAERAAALRRARALYPLSPEIDETVDLLEESR